MLNHIYFLHELRLPGVADPHHGALLQGEQNRLKHGLLYDRAGERREQVVRGEAILGVRLAGEGDQEQLPQRAGAPAEGPHV